MKKFAKALSLYLMGLAVAHAAEYPERPIRIILPQPAGGGGDLVLRAMQPELQQRLQQPVVIDNRPGGNELIGSDAVAKAAPDGYTLGLISSTFSINQLGLGAKPPFDSQKDFVGVASLVRVPMAIFVPNDLGVNDMKSLVQVSKQRPGQLNYVSLGPTTFQGISAEWLKKVSGVDMTAIPFGGRGSIQAILAGDVQIVFLGMGAAGPLLQSGKVKPIAVTSKTRMKNFPDVPAISEAYPSYDVTPWYGIVAPAGTPPAILKKLNEAFNAVLTSPTMMAKYPALGSEPVQMSVEEFQRHMTDDLSGWRDIVKASK